MQNPYKIAKKEAKRVFKSKGFNQINDFKMLSKIKEEYEVKLRANNDLVDYNVFLLLTAKLDNLKNRTEIYY